MTVAEKGIVQRSPFYCSFHSNLQSPGEDNVSTAPCEVFQYVLPPVESEASLQCSKPRSPEGGPYFSWKLLMDVFHSMTEQFVTKRHNRKKRLFVPSAFVTHLEHKQKMFKWLLLEFQLIQKEIS